MSRPGFSINRAIARKEWGFDQTVQPFFHKGDDVGCLVLHGFLGTPANMRVIADALFERGWTVYAPLLSGHGTTLADMDRQSDEVWISDAFAAYERLRREGCTQIILIGLSMGGLLASILAQQVECAGLVLLNTPFRMQEYLYRAMKLAGIVPFLEVHSDPARAASAYPYNQVYGGLPVRKLRDLERLTIRARGGLYRIGCPLLVMQSRQDNKVDLSSVMITQYGIRSESVRVEWLENSPHGCSYGPEREYIAKRCVEFAEQALGGSSGNIE
ncbi:MAG: alpha/beta fold hydrolase [Bacillota bacterium]